MTPSHATLSHLLDDLLGSSDVVLRARAENVRFEERVSQQRWGCYEAEHPPAGSSYEDWLESHKDYLEGLVYTALPETFLSVNSEAALPAAVTSDLGEGQILIRVESLDYALGESKVGSLANLENVLAIYNNQRRDPNVTAGDAKALLHEVCRSLNQNPYAVRPRFAAFAQELAEDSEAHDWPLRLRDRLGLAHLAPTNAFGPHPVALMRYTVKDVAEHARKLNANHPLAVPTVLDAEPYEIFHPSPREQNYGRTLDLAGAGDCDRLASEVLHLRIDYAPSNLWKVGAITTRADTSSERLARLRSDHLACLQLLSDRDDFGIL
ncbi:MAG: hypothetical protein V5B40_02425 [Candidatus Accumulibacter meliphilus]|uniref:hypothetical protein n=1 Tax=Candidatus Accumulibacter meliphilus TaxID=2211374 RepID=UPI002FC2A085